MKVALNIQDLNVSFASDEGTIDVVKNASITVNEGEIVGLVGESGSGKTLSAMCAMGLQPGSARVVAKRIEVAGHDVTRLDHKSLASIRGSEVALVPQEPMNSLNPTMRIGKQLQIVIRSHQAVGSGEARGIALDFLERMLISEPDRVMRSYPFELSGGMLQRVLLAMAFSCRPRILIADEPTTALDVTVQKEVLELLRDSARTTQTAVLFITHDLAVVWNLCQRVYVMCQGEIVESGLTRDVIGTPEHVYTQSLLAALPINSPRRTFLPVSKSATGGPAGTHCE